VGGGEVGGCVGGGWGGGWDSNVTLFTLTGRKHCVRHASTRGLISKF